MINTANTSQQKAGSQAVFTTSCLVWVCLMACDTSRKVIRREYLGFPITAWTLHCKNVCAWKDTDPVMQKSRSDNRLIGSSLILATCEALEC